jgi:hypothetical protein
MPTSRKSATTTGSRRNDLVHCKGQGASGEIPMCLFQDDEEMSVDEPRDVLNELLQIASRYQGTRPWTPKRGATTSNPVKRLSSARKAVLAHPRSRNGLSAREGAALVYALSLQGVALSAGAVFSRTFRHRDQRALMLENGVLRDLLAVGVISQAEGFDADRFLVTGLGVNQINGCFPGHGL